ncbi:sulfotransferase family 2 domain-containing protein [Nocardioides sp.]|uniref:sulfotransferase family 2 domain-containing protein n=1 Tax=Nocardioides sp. TaxID=35761 RepID=UPI002F404AB4
MTVPSSPESDPLAALVARKGAMWRTYAAVDARVLFVQVNKNACTSLKWMMAAIAGEDLAGFGPSLGASARDADDIHDRRQWHVSPRLDEMDPELRAQIHPDNGWFVFAVTRDPRARLFSAWQSKLLLDNPGYTSYRKEDWYPRHPVSTESVVEDFATFVDLFVREPHHRIRGDGHFRDQVELLHEDVVTYTHIYDVGDLGRLQVDLRNHLDRVGWTGELTLPRMNDTPLRANGLAFGNGIEEQVRKIYAADFERFGDRWDLATIDNVPLWTAAELTEVDHQASMGRRIGYLRNQALAFRDEAVAQRRLANRQRARADRLRRKLDARPTTAVAPPGSLRRTMDRLGRRARRWLRRS